MYIFRKQLLSNNKKLPNRAFSTNNKIIKILYNKFVVKDSIYVTIYINIVKVYIILGQKFKIEIVYEKILVDNNSCLIVQIDSE